MPKPTVFDLRNHSVLDLNRLDMAINSGIRECGENPALAEMKETLLSYQRLVNEAMAIVQDNESKEWVENQVRDILGK